MPPVRARESLQQFADSHGQRITTYYVENVSGARLERPELMRMIDEAYKGDILLIEAVDRLTRLSAEDWDSLSNTIKAKGLIVVALDLPTSYIMMNTAPDTEAFQTRMNAALNAMMLDTLAAMSRKDYLQRQSRQGQGIKRLKADIDAGKTTKRLGAKVSTNQERIIMLLKKGVSWTEIEIATGASRSTVVRAARKLKTESA